jgi:hypothetical protein
MVIFFPIPLEKRTLFVYMFLIGWEKRITPTGVKEFFEINA